MDAQTTIKEQNYFVVKANDLIRKSRYTLTLMEQKAVLYAISKIQPMDEPFKLYEYDLMDFCKVCGLNTDGGKYNIQTQSLIDRLNKRDLVIKLAGDEILYTHWFSSIKISPSRRKITFRIAPELAPYLYDLKAHYTQYSLYEAIQMHSKYSIRLFEYLVSVKSMNPKHTLSIEQLRERMDCTDIYPQFGEFKRNALEPAIKEINACTNLTVTYNTKTKGRKVTGIEFELKADYEE